MEERTVIAETDRLILTIFSKNSPTSKVGDELRFSIRQNIKYVLYCNQSKL